MVTASRLLGCFTAIVLLCVAHGPLLAATATPGSVDPPTAPEAGTTGVVEPEKQVKKSKVRHRHARYRYRRNAFFFPPPYWFRSGWSRHRYHRRHPFPFFFHFRW